MNRTLYLTKWKGQCGVAVFRHVLCQSWSDSWLCSGLVCAVPSPLSVSPDISRACWVHHTPGRHLCKLIQYRLSLSQHHQYLTRNWPQNNTCHNHTYEWMKNYFISFWKTNWVDYVTLRLDRPRSTGWNIVLQHWDVSQFLYLIRIWRCLFATIAIGREPMFTSPLCHFQILFATLLMDSNIFLISFIYLFCKLQVNVV